MRKIFLLLLLPSLGAVQLKAIGGNGVPKEMVTPYGGPDTTVLNHKVRLPKDTVVVPSATSQAVRKNAQSLPSSISSPKVYEQINNNIVAGYINNFATRYSQHLQVMISRGQPYFVMVEKIFREHGIPEEMKYLAVIESSFNTNARSRVGAVGAWQFMSGTARIFGLNVGKKVDERKDFYKSTVAAAKFLNELYNQFGDWLLVVAAYNCGPGGVQRAMNASGRSDFWGMQYFLPAESRNHVYKFIATGYILDRFNNFFGVGNDGVAAPVSAPAMTSAASSTTELTEEEMFNTVEFNISGKYRLDAIAKKLNMEVSELEHLNPEFAKMMASPENSYDLRIPKDKMKEFQTEKDEILKESLQMMLDDKATALDKSRFPAPAKVAAPAEAKAKKTTTNNHIAAKTSKTSKAVAAKKPAAKGKTATAKKKTVAKKTTAKKPVTKKPVMKKTTLH
ncbi:lytic transglycosylase domain-containing protein [Chitinophaga rhizophila]|uniref:Lytic transglycosylase domain-containing protein n=1 Tax=Chitinophaga rhizophila TaxID=2866212 RepID=A0ABS7GG49_9BACT|nr:lytic transglycosylase domain-containing protein [Chitinophaga rhizophila]MBW8686664.1 lytic transglycosylase domain-containing protein [Chitinophaga rhizophila]